MIELAQALRAQRKELRLPLNVFHDMDLESAQANLPSDVFSLLVGPGEENGCVPFEITDTITVSIPSSDNKYDERHDPKKLLERLVRGIHADLVYPHKGPPPVFVVRQRRSKPILFGKDNTGHAFARVTFSGLASWLEYPK